MSKKVRLLNLNILYFLISIKKHQKMHQFETIAGIKHKECIPISVKSNDDISKDDISKDDTYYKAIEIARAACKDRIMLFRKDDDKLTLLNPFDIVDKPTCFVVVNINDRTLKSCAEDGLIV
jgi:hypothetical protein